MKISLLSFARKGALLLFTALPAQGATETCAFLLKKAVNSPTALSSANISAQKCPLTADLVFWIQVRKDAASVTFQQVAHFLNHHPDWPQANGTQTAGEKKLTPAVPQNLILSFFSKHPPRTFQGRVYFIQALLRANQKEKAQKLIQETWRETSLTLEEQKQFLDRFSQTLTRQDHEARLMYFLWEKSGEQAQQVFSRVSKPLQRQASVWLAFLKEEPSAITQYMTLPADIQQKEGLYLAHIAFLKKEKRFEEAIQRLLAFKGPITKPIAWWKERNYLAREMVQIKNYALADQVLQNHSLTSTKEFAEAEWFSGWLCLSFLGNPEGAKARFFRFQEVVKTPISLARAGYWLGRTHETLKDTKKAREFYEKASLYKTTFYGQLAAHKIGKSPFPTFHETPPVDGKTRHLFEKKELVQIVRLLAQTGPSGQHYVRKFLEVLAALSTTSAQKQLTVALAGEVHSCAAAEINRSVADISGVVMKAGYPVLPLPPAPPGSQAPEPALVMALIHKETRFNSQAVGDAGERGLMQLMPQTAAIAAENLGIPHSADRLFDPQYNMKLGIAHLASDLVKFNNSYPLAIGSYNAGGTPLLRWIEEMGDPHQGELDVVDWIERIPYASVRDYVQRVLENITTYRARLGKKDRHLAHDLRGRG